MKRLLLLILVALLLPGCTTMTVEMAQPDGTNCKASYTSMFKAFDSANGSVCGATAGAEKSGSDELSTALTGALIRGLGVQ